MEFGNGTHLELEFGNGTHLEQTFGNITHLEMERIWKWNTLKTIIWKENAFGNGTLLECISDGSLEMERIWK